MSNQTNSRSLAQILAIHSQIHLPGTAGRILHQIRELESVAPLFIKAGLVKGVDRPTPLNLKISGIGTRSALKKTVGSFLFVSAAVRIDLLVKDNVVSTAGYDSQCEIDDIGFEDQSKILQTNEIGLAYKLVDSGLQDFQPDIVLMDCPLIMNRSMVPVNRSGGEEGAYSENYARTIEIIASFWQRWQSGLYPWNKKGAVVAGVAAQRFGAIIHSALADLRQTEGRQQVLDTEGADPAVLAELERRDQSIKGIGERRFVFGLLGNFTRTAAFRMNVHTPRMEPAEVVKMGVLGLHYRANHNAGPHLLQLIGDAPGWEAVALNKIAGQVMALTATGGERALPFPLQLAQKELKSLDYFLENYKRAVAAEMRNRKIEAAWLEDMNDFADDQDF